MPWQLQQFNQHWALHCEDDPQQAPFDIDFNTPALRRRVQQFGAKQPLAKAIGFKPSQPLHVIDATAGLGRDALLIASLGCEVTLMERNEILGVLLQQALESASTTSLAALVSRMRFQAGDARHLLKATTADVVLIDPMFPERKKSALVKKEMQIMQALIGHDSDNEGLLDSALCAATKRVVVKRPRVGPCLDNKKPDVQFISKTHRFDVYLIR